MPLVFPISNGMNWFFYISPVVLQTLIWPVSRPLFRFFLHLEIYGFENLKGVPRGVIFASNHVGELDAILLPTSLPFLSRFSPIFYVSRENKFYRWTPGWRKFMYGGLFFNLLGSHPARIGERNYAVALKTHVGILKHRKSMYIFPQGGVTDKTGKMTMRGEPVSVKGGVGYLSHATELPVVPVYLEGCHQIPAREFWTRKRRVKVVFGKPLYPKDLFTNPQHVDTDGYKFAAKRIMSAVERLRDTQTAPAYRPGYAAAAKR